MKFLFLLLCSFPVLAGFNGKFSGTGAAVYHSGKRYECSEIFLNLKTTKESFELKEGGYNCGFLKAGFDPFKLTIKEGKLFHQELELGVIHDSKIHYQYFDPEDGSTYSLTLTRDENNHLHYWEEWHDGVKLALTVKGQLILMKETL